MKQTALMKIASTCRIVLVVIFSGVILFPPVFNEAIAEMPSENDAAVDADTRLITVEDFRALEAALADLRSQLAAQQALTASQQEEIEGQRKLLQSVQVQVGLSAEDQIVDRPLGNRQPHPAGRYHPYGRRQDRNKPLGTGSSCTSR